MLYIYKMKNEKMKKIKKQNYEKYIIYKNNRNRSSQ